MYLQRLQRTRKYTKSRCWAQFYNFFNKRKQIRISPREKTHQYVISDGLRNKILRKPSQYSPVSLNADAPIPNNQTAASIIKIKVFQRNHNVKFKIAISRTSHEWQPTGSDAPALIADSHSQSSQKPIITHPPITAEPPTDCQHQKAMPIFNKALIALLASALITTEAFVVTPPSCSSQVRSRISHIKSRR